MHDVTQTADVIVIGAGVHGASLAFHLLVPVGHHADFRFIFPVVVPVSVLFAQAAEALRQRRLALGHAGYLVAAVFLALSTAYFLSAKF